MFTARTLASSGQLRKPKIFIDKSFMSLDGIDVGVKGQLECILVVRGISKEMDENGNEILNYTLEFSKLNSVELQ